MREAGLVHSHRSDADGRALYYGLDLAGLRAGLAAASGALQLDSKTVDAPQHVGPVLFVCTHNSARSQIAEGWLRQLSGGRIAARSAGTEPGAIHPLAVRVMAEAGIDIGHQRSKALDAVADLRPAAVVTVCDLAREQCAPSLAAPLQIHWSTPDPARGAGDEDERLAAFRAARDQLRVRVEGLLALLPTMDAPLTG